jgi:hypothetical protein
VSDFDAILPRVKRRALLLAAVLAAGAFVHGWRSGVSLTITAAVVIFSLLVLEKLTERLLPRQDRSGFARVLPLLLVTAASVGLLAAVLLFWKEFDPVAGAAGGSVVVLAIVPEVFRRPRGA